MKHGAWLLVNVMNTKRMLNSMVLLIIKGLQLVPKFLRDSIAEESLLL